MNGISPNNNKESPKTPSGISKSLLTPCRRVGLSRKWRKSGSSPFISPLSAQSVAPERTEVREEKIRKKYDENEHMETAKEELNSVQRSSECSQMSCDSSNQNKDIISTPCRNTQLPQRKVKILSLSLQNSQETFKDYLVNEKHMQPHKLFKVDVSKTKVFDDRTVNTKTYEGLKNTQVVMKVTPTRLSPEQNSSKLTRTESKTKKLSLKKSISKSKCSMSKPESKQDSFENPRPKENSPNNLTKECIVVIQNKMLKIDSGISENETEKTLNESDSEPDVPPNILKREINQDITLNSLIDKDFIGEPFKKKLRNLSTIKKNNVNLNTSESGNTSQSSQEDIDKRTILVKKTYEKVIKPEKAKSTGSITQKDIDDLKARIEMKKKLLLAKAMSIDTEELRGLVKKWQKGCQDALMELLDLMKKKLPDRQSMDYGEILEALKIPAELVGYDPENDCFITPDDTNVLLSAFKL